MLSSEQMASFEENGFLLVENYASGEEVDELRAQMEKLLAEIELDHHSVFSTNVQTQTSDRYFLESGDKIRCFFESIDLKDGQDKSLKINKVGHALHDLNEVFERFSYKQALLDIALQFGHEEPAIIQSQYIFKSPKVGGNVSPHTDSTFLYTEPLSCLGAWIALEDVDEENACLWGLPGSHTEYPLYNRFKRNESNDGTLFEDLVERKDKWKLSGAVPLVAKKGDLILLHGSNVHMSEANQSERSRNAYVLHLVDLAAEYPADNWLQREELPLRKMREVV